MKNDEAQCKGGFYGVWNKLLGHDTKQWVEGRKSQCDKKRVVLLICPFSNKLLNRCNFISKMIMIYVCVYIYVCVCVCVCVCVYIYVCIQELMQTVFRLNLYILCIQFFLSWVHSEIWSEPLTVDGEVSQLLPCLPFLLSSPQAHTEKAMAPHSSTLAWKIHGQSSLVGCSPWCR